MSNRLTRLDDILPMINEPDEQYSEGVASGGKKSRGGGEFESKS